MSLRKSAIGVSLMAGCLFTASAAEVGFASFNLAWAGTASDFSRHVQVCSSPAVNWCDTRAKVPKGATEPTKEEKDRAKLCQVNIDRAAGGAQEAMQVAPCNAYKLTSKKATANVTEMYEEKLQGLRETLDMLIVGPKVKIFAFQEVKSAEVISEILGAHVADFEICVAPHSAFQTVGFAWRKNLSEAPAKCNPENALSIKENPKDPASLRFLRPGLSLELVVNGAPITVMNVHLKSACANLVNGGGFVGRELTDADPACQILNRQVVPLENWIERVAASSPRFIVMGDFNRKIDEEAKIKVALDRVRTDGSDRAGPNKANSNGQVSSRYLWWEISDGTPSLHQVSARKLSTGCNGFLGLDHILLSPDLYAQQPNEPNSVKLPVLQKTNQKIITSDHCPRVTNLNL